MDYRLRSMLTAVALTFSSVTALMVTAASPADAATGASLCFKWDTGAAYASQPVQLYSQYSGAKLRDGRTNARGCGTFTGLTSTGKYIVRAYNTLPTPYGTHIYDGWTPYQTGPGRGTVDLGTGVSSYQATL